MKMLCVLRFTLLAAVLVGSLGLSLAQAEECDGNYFGENDSANEVPLSRPAKEFAVTYKAAKNGNASAQRSLAVSYETGYLVSKCADKAAYWYGKAAAAGDEGAKKWVSRYKIFSAIRSGPECAGYSCLGRDADEQRVAVLYASANRNDHFFAAMTINGRTVEGLIDTGASSIAVSVETARQLGISFAEGDLGRASTAGGNISTFNVNVPLVDIAGIKLRNIRVTVGISGEPLIGMSFLSRINMSISSGVLTMAKR